MPKSQTIGVCAIIINHDNQVLLGKRKNSYKAGLYGLPGGRVKLNEPLQLAVEREVKEETELCNLQFSFVGIVRENQGDYDFIDFMFTAQINKQQPRLCEPEKCEGWEWFNVLADLTEIMPGHKADIELYRNKQYLADLITNDK